MSSARFTKLDLLQDSANRLFDMIRSLPDVSNPVQQVQQSSAMSLFQNSDAVSQSVANVEEEHKGESPIVNAAATLSAQDWYNMLMRRAKPPKSFKLDDVILTSDLILDELVRFEALITSTYAIAVISMKDKKSGIAPADSTADLKKASLEDTLPLLIQLIPKDANVRRVLSAKINMLNDVIERVRVTIQKTVSQSQYDASKISPILTFMDSALRGADQASDPEKQKSDYLKQNVNYLRTKAAAELKSKIKSVLTEQLQRDGATEEVIKHETDAALTRFDVEHKDQSGPLTAEELNALSERWDGQARVEHDKLNDLQRELATINANYNYDLTYSASKLKRLFFVVSALAGKAPVASTANVQVPLQSSASTSSSQSQESGDVVSLSPADATRMNHFRKKPKIVALNDATHRIASDNGLSRELKYHLILLAMMTTLSETRQRGVGWSTTFWSPSTLRVELQSQLISFLEMSQKDSLTNVFLYHRAKVPHAEIQKIREDNRNDWFVEVAATLFEKTFRSLRLPEQTALLSERFDRFLEVPKENRLFRDAVFEELHRRGVYNTMLQTLYTRLADREKARKDFDLPEPESFDKKKRPSPSSSNQ
jgi:hypothetical protein